ncbi:hypothetical protein HMPREF0185_03549 [Brevundimonas diminuta 470-4]|nr:hypothetical protein HMPREF0185_03549 [Brevundimonas diminuta 470-4]
MRSARPEEIKSCHQSLTFGEKHSFKPRRRADGPVSVSSS